MFGNIYNASAYATADPLSAIYQSGCAPQAQSLGMMGGAMHPGLGLGMAGGMNPMMSGALGGLGMNPMVSGGLAGLGGFSALGSQGITPQLLSQCPSPYAFAQYASTAGPHPAAAGIGMHHLQQQYAIHGPATGQFGARGSPFNVAAGGASVVAELQEIGKDLMVDRARDFHHLEVINDLVDARCHGRQLDTIIQALVRGIPVPQHQIAQILLQERQVDHAADNLIRTIVNESKYNRRADEILANLVSGRPHLRRYDEAIKNRKDDAFDAVIDTKAAQVCTVASAAAGQGWLPLTRNRAKKELVAVRELMTRSPIAGTPGLNAILSIAPTINSLYATGAVQGVASAIDNVTAGGCALGSVIASGGPRALIGGPHLGGVGAFSAFSPFASAMHPAHTAAFNPLLTSGVNPLFSSGVNPLFSSGVNPLFSGVNPLISGVSPLHGAGMSSLGVNPLLASGCNPLLASGVNPLLSAQTNPLFSGINPLHGAGMSSLLGAAANPAWAAACNPMLGSAACNPMLGSAVHQQFGMSPFDIGFGAQSAFNPQTMGYGAASMMGSGLGNIAGVNPLWSMQNPMLGAGLGFGGLGAWNPLGSANAMAY